MAAFTDLVEIHEQVSPVRHGVRSLLWHPMVVDDLFGTLVGAVRWDALSQRTRVENCWAPALVSRVSP